MACEYFHSYHSYLKSIEPLNDAERGRLWTALLIYSSTGTVPELKGNERFLFPTMKEQIDRDKANYEKKCQTNSQNGKKGGRPKNRTVSEKTERFLEKANKSEKSQGEGKGEGKEKGEGESTAIARARDALSVDVLREFENMKPSPSETDIENLAFLVERHGEAKLLSAIKDAKKKGGKSVAYIAKILEGLLRSKPLASSGRYGPTYDIGEIESLLDDDWAE